jgi:hypothetical protein
MISFARVEGDIQKNHDTIDWLYYSFFVDSLNSKKNGTGM